MLPSQLMPHKHFSNANASLTILLTLPTELPDASLTTPSQLPNSFFPIDMQIILLTVRANEQLAKRELTALTGGGGGGGVSHKGLRKKFHDYSMTSPKSKFPYKKIPIFVFAVHVSICRINYRQTQTHTHTHRQTHDLIKDNRLFSWFY